MRAYGRRKRRDDLCHAGAARHGREAHVAALARVRHGRRDGAVLVPDVDHAAAVLREARRPVHVRIAEQREAGPHAFLHEGLGKDVVDVALHRAPGTRRVFRNCSSVSPRKAATISGFETALARASFSRQKKLAPWSCSAFQSSRRTMSFSSWLRPSMAASGVSRKSFRLSLAAKPCRNRLIRSPRPLRSRSNRYVTRRAPRPWRSSWAG